MKRKDKDQWERAKPFIPIVNTPISQFPLKKFSPAYEKDQVNLKWLLAHEYQRLWLHEKKIWDRLHYPPKEDSSQVKRKGTNRLKTHREREEENSMRIDRWRHAKGRVIPNRSQPPEENIKDDSSFKSINDT